MRRLTMLSTCMYIDIYQFFEEAGGCLKYDI